MKNLFFTIAVILFLLLIAAIFKIYKLKNIKYSEPEILSGKKILIVYYSNNGNTRNVSDNLQLITNGDMEQIRIQEKYPDNIFEKSKVIRNQIKQGYLPKADDIDISSYDVIFVGSPIWNFSMSLPMKAFLKNNNFENKVLIPFFTYSGGANKNKIINEIRDLTNAKDIKKPIFIFENGIILTKEQIISKLNNL